MRKGNIIMKMGRGNEKVELSVIVVEYTEKAILVHDGSGVEQWLPRSQIESEDPVLIGSVMRIEIPEWLAKAKKFAF